MLNKPKHILFLNGEPPSEFPDIASFETVFCTDGAYDYLKKNHIRPDYVCGDFDSNKQHITSPTQKIILPNQDQTDFEKTIQFILSKGIKSLEIWGANHGSIDHFLGNLHVAIRFNHQIEMIFHDTKQYYFLCPHQLVLQCKPNTLISLYPFPKAENIVLTGFKYPLKNEDLVIGERIGIRNEVVDLQQNISIEKGDLFVIIQK